MPLPAPTDDEEAQRVCQLLGTVRVMDVSKVTGPIDGSQGHKMIRDEKD